MYHELELDLRIISFWSNVNIRTDTSLCWEWMGTKDREGYGTKSIKGLGNKAHQVAYTLSKGVITPGMCVLHKCDNPACVNPLHLFLGTQLENIADRQQKGRTARELKNARAKLSDDQVAEIRRLYGEKAFDGVELAKMYNVKHPTIYNIVNNKRRLNAGG
jgi:hypothetical protein